MPPAAGRSRGPRARWLVLGVLVVVLATGGTALYTRWNSVRTHFAGDTCTVGSYEIDPAQAATASTMIGAVTSFRPSLPDRAAVLTLAAALQESKLSNIAPGAGDRDSVGVLQQRPSQGWGSVAGQADTIAARTRRLTDVHEATVEFLTALVRDVPNWRTLPLAQAVQAVQRSADGSLYAQHEPEATALAAALLGRTPAAISCDIPAPAQVATAAQVAAQARSQLGIDSPVARGTSVQVPGAHWQTSAWFVANADRLGIDRVEYAGYRWTRTGSWTHAASVSAAAVVATMATVTN